jgi:hypothetical protein
LFFVRGVRVPSAWNYGAVERALRDAGERTGCYIFEPAIGKIFCSPEEAYQFYNMFSWECGFGIRFGRFRCNKKWRRQNKTLYAHARLVTVCFGYLLLRKLINIRNLFGWFLSFITHVWCAMRRGMTGRPTQGQSVPDALP